MSKNTGAIPVTAAVSKLSDLMPSTLSRSFFSQPVSQMDAPPPKNLKKEKKKDKKGKKSKDKMDKKDKKKKTKQDKRAKLEANKRLSSSQPDVLLSSSSSWQTRNNGFSASQPQPTLNKKLQEQRASTSKQQQLPKQGLSTRPPMDFQEPNAVGISASSSTAPLTAPDTAQMAKILERIDSMNRRIVTVGATASHLSTKTDNLENHSKSVDERLANIEKLMSSMHEMLKEITNRQKRKVAVRPQYLPFKTLADILAFSSDESSTDDRSSGTEDDNNARVSDSDATDIFRETHSNYL